MSDLKSRLGAAPNIRIHAPDETLIAAVMVKMFADQQMDVGADVLAYLVNRMDRSFEAAGSGNQAEQRVAGCQAGNYRAACPRCAGNAGKLR